MSPLSSNTPIASATSVQPIADRARARSRLLGPIVLVAGLSLVLVGASTTNVVRTYRGFRDTVQKDFRLGELSGNIIHIDEVLTMSARMAVSTGDSDSRWEERYNEFVPLLDSAIEETIALAPEFANSSEQVDAANIALVDLETQAFELLARGEREAAFDLLFSSFYEDQKQIYASGIGQTLTGIKQANAERLTEYSRSLSRAAISAGVSLPLLLGSWAVVLWLIRNYIRERNQSQASLEQSRGELLQLNGQLGAQVEQRTAQEQAAKQESEVLQQDVREILNVVSAVEDGDLTVVAPVSDRVTGLVSDTLNRLIEELGLVLAQVLSTANQVSQGANGLDGLGKTVSTNAEQQARSVAHVLALTNRVEAAARDSADRVQQAGQLLQNMQHAVTEGESGMTALNQGIAVLQEGTERIVQQMKTLGEFVGLADQFVQEQSQIASLTQILAMNAELVASRAAEQRDPRQFAVVAREFEAIAEQVNDLAQQTNEGLSSLEKRTNQIHLVVSTIDSDVQSLGGLVEQFTQGVEQSNDVFRDIRGVTGQVTQAGDTVTTSNREIVASAQSTAKAIREIANLAAKTARLTRQAREQSESMDSLSGQLLERVQFFRLPAAVPTASELEQRLDLSEAEELTVATSAIANRGEAIAPTGIF